MALLKTRKTALSLMRDLGLYSPPSHGLQGHDWKMDCRNVSFSRHAFERMFQRGINPDAVMQIVAEGEVIAEYPDDAPFPSVLLLGYFSTRPVHAVVAREAKTGNCHLVTIYWPAPEIWDETFKRRRAK